MSANPLDSPNGQTPLLLQFLDYFQIIRTGDIAKDVANVARAFAHLPYENLTKIVRHAEVGKPTYRLPQNVLEEHIAWGTGGTCFSLTATLLHLVRALGVEAEPILADRPYGLDTHAALVVWIDGMPHLVDPGYLITEPLPLINEPQFRQTSFNELILQPAEGDRLSLSTVSHGRTVHRLSFKTAPAETAEFMRAWDASFDWEMMHYPVLTRVDGNVQRYLQDRRLQSRSREKLSKREIPLEELSKSIQSEFGLNLVIVDRALRILHMRGDIHG